jgi:hypothetical protein
LSVSSDRIALAAWRCARLLSGLQNEGRPVDRKGNGGVYEAYPGAALTRWGLNRKEYKTRGTITRPQGEQARTTLLAELRKQASWLDVSSAEESCVKSDDAFDAMIASLVARAASQALTDPPPLDGPLRERVMREGWIHLPLPQSLSRQLLGE